MTDLPAFAAEVNPDLAALLRFVRLHSPDARLRARPIHRGYIAPQSTTYPDGTTKTVLYVRDARRKRGQRSPIFGLDDVELKDESGRYRPAREVIA